ncbi:MerR family DNA-binding transcriptional regulator [Nocardia concava]|uniref:MerR family DNA-binding transcriptional regulator n=1 Tax=Nocardia concava TaxID=257281 RepID=UPI0002ED2972|nr:MerR family DNA-binding transcriptional regulator [Nocardia concava]
MVDPNPEAAPAAGLTTAEIAERYGRKLNTVQKHWVTDPRWPAALPVKRGKWKVYDAAAVDEVVRALFLVEPPEPAGDPDDLLTQAEVAEYLGIAPSTLRGYISRGQYVEPDVTEGGQRWYRRTVDANRPKRRPAVRRADR